MANATQGTRGTESYGNQRPENFGTRITRDHAIAIIKDGRKRKKKKSEKKK